MNKHTAISCIQRHSPLPAAGTYDAATMAEIGEALEYISQHPTRDTASVLLTCANDDSDPYLMQGAARALIECPADSLESCRVRLTDLQLPLRWRLAIYRLFPDWTSRDQLQQWLQEETNADLREDLELTIEVLFAPDVPDEIDASIDEFKRHQELPQICQKADEAFRRKDYAEVVRLLNAYRDMLPPVHQKKLSLAERKAAR